MAKQRQTQLRDSRTLKEKLSGKAMEDHKAVQQVSLVKLELFHRVPKVLM